ncbi:homocysteine S-methyltransferase family protein [bacterium]|nr:homocysteine S-methyltransferase family protein [bacterium]
MPSKRAIPAATPQAVQSLTARPILLDGALGTELERRGVSCKLPLWTAEAIMEAPEQVRAVHRSYVEAGAHVITAGTFRTTRWVFSKVGMPERAKEVTMRAVQLARDAASAKQDPAPTLVAGSIAPLEDCYHPELAPGDLVLQAEHRHNAQTLAEAGVDIILVETQNSLREARIATHFARQTGIPVWTSFILKSDTELLNGDSLRDAARDVVKYGAAAVLVNCISPQIAAQAVMNLSMHVHGEIMIGVYPNALDRSITPGEFADWGINIKSIADIIGGCCGIAPEHISALQRRLSTIA